MEKNVFHQGSHYQVSIDFLPIRHTTQLPCAIASILFICLFHCQTIYKQHFVMQDLKIAIPHHSSILYCSTKSLSPFKNHDSPCESVCHTYLKVSRESIIPSNLKNLILSYVYHPLESDCFLEDAVMQKRQSGCFL